MSRISNALNNLLYCQPLEIDTAMPAIQIAADEECPISVVRLKEMETVIIGIACSVIKPSKKESSQQLVGSHVFHCFDKSELETWLQQSNTCPSCRENAEGKVTQYFVSAKKAKLLFKQMDLDRCHEKSAMAFDPNCDKSLNLYPLKAESLNVKLKPKFEKIARERSFKAFAITINCLHWISFAAFKVAAFAIKWIGHIGKYCGKIIGIPLAYAGAYCVGIPFILFYYHIFRGQGSPLVTQVNAIATFPGTALVIGTGVAARFATRKSAQLADFMKPSHTPKSIWNNSLLQNNYR